MTDAEVSGELVDFVASSPSMFHSARTIVRYLDEAGFAFLPEGSRWELEPGGSYYTTRNNSSVVAFRVGEELDGYHFQLAASHSDSPSFKVKSVPELEGPGPYLRLNVEGYGGMIDYSWLDRPLSLAGRVMVQEGDSVRSELFAPDRDLLLIPSVPVHMNRDVNDGYAFNHQVDLCPLASAGELGAGWLDQLVADELGVDVGQVLARDLFLTNRVEGRVWGATGEFVSAGHLDDLQCAFASLKGFLASANPHDVSVYACLDNEEVGSNTKQGALSTLLRDVLVRVNAGLGRDGEELARALARSFMVSCDNAHAVHPNHPEKCDEANRSWLNGGIVVKEAANQSYTTDAFSRAAFLAICRRAGVPVQCFANRSDSRGGSTLGNLSNMQVSMHAVDVGLPQLAMHSAYETAGVRDTVHAIRALEAFYSCDLRIDGADGFTLS
ncbi:hypothetical protein HMPREF1008_01127 [Olsenella sp. oral taxon 809 str. F0356]|uniref:M18 family aminopeptidase n=1 Tax=Olsenella sp. oral taxon 809 TaxID=661086 RepID=UPI000231EE0A|nr:M18 family aminopeptidase [Olsenella sp. oral taxon 809]EHF01503.1 hypothetical protein HMPREF1008_01127 [Olsenella sp. oral taxon 809 str. F0356]